MRAAPCWGPWVRDNSMVLARGALSICVRRRARNQTQHPVPKRTPLNLQIVRRLFLALPGVEEGPCYGTPGFRVRGKFLARLWEDGETLVVKCGADERDFRMQVDPTTFFTTAHYRGYPTVLVRLTRVRA